LIRDFQEGRLKRFYRAAVPPSLAGLPWARRELIERRAYGRGVLIATRSCPNACGYCMLPHYYHHQYRCRPGEEVIAEAASIQEKALIFWDDNIIGNLDYARELFRGLIPLRKRWTSQATFNIVDHDDLIQLAAASGCEALFIGLESISAASLRETGKAFNHPRRYLDGIKKLHDAGIAVQTGLVFGFDHDDVTVFERTLEFLEQAGVDVASIGSLTPFPGTPIFRKLEEEGRILTRDWSKYNARTDVVFRPRQMTPDQLQAGVEWVTKQFYSLSSISRRLLVGPEPVCGGTFPGIWATKSPSISSEGGDTIPPVNADLLTARQATSTKNGRVKPNKSVFNAKPPRREGARSFNR
jgi:radical SAM superfamily enzyme YgiQ (UPF0313 family)